MLPRSCRPLAEQPPSAGPQHNPQRNIIGPFSGRAGAGIGTGEPHIEAAARRVHDIAGDPVMAPAASVGEVMTAHGLGVAREAARQIGGWLITGISGSGRGAGTGAKERMAVEKRGENRRAAILGDRHEEPQAPGDDLGDEAERLQLRRRRRRRSRSARRDARPSPASGGSADRRRDRARRRDR